MSKMAPVSPKEIIKEEFLNKCLDYPKWIDEFATEEGHITPKLADKLATYFSTSSEFWVNLQANYDKDMKNV